MIPLSPRDDRTLLERVEEARRDSLVVVDRTKKAVLASQLLLQQLRAQHEAEDHPPVR